jgi:cobalt-zinc-cadmium efflux system outer membrane protein
MLDRSRQSQSTAPQTLAWLAVLTCAILRPGGAHAAEPSPPPALTLEAAIQMGLERNPELIALRQQHGIAEAGVVIAQTYPFNPVLESKVRYASGPISAGITNRVSNEHKLLMDVEIHGQGGIRRRGAAAALSRTDFEITAQETALAIRIRRAFDTALNRAEKLKVTQETIKENTAAAALVEKLVNGGILKVADLYIIRAEVDDVTAQLKIGETAFVAAAHDFYRAVGIVGDPVQLLPGPALPTLKYDSEALVEAALKQRPDLHARQLAVEEASAKLLLEKANRHGNPNFGPAYEYDPTRINLIGVQATLPFPVFNTHRGEILQREAELTRASLEARQVEIQVRQDIYAALARLDKAQASLDTYRKKNIPNLEKTLVEMRKLLEAKEADMLRVLDVQRKILKARETELDALLEVQQALADLAAALGDPTFAATPPPRP